MKIGILTGGSIPTPMAHSFNVMKMAQGFASLGHDVEVVTAASLKISRWRKKISNIYSHYGIRNDIKVTWLSPSFWSYFSGRTSNDPVYCRRAARYSLEQGFNLVYCRSYLIPSYTAKAGIPTFIETHTTNYDIRPLQEIYEVAPLEAFKGLVTIHESIKKEHMIRGVPKEKVLVLQDGVDLERFDIKDDPLFWRDKLGLGANKKYAVYCGHLYPEKGIEVILESAKMLEHNKDLVFLLVGGFEKDRRHWEEYCKQKEISNVQFTGFIENASVPQYLKSADVLLLPYKLDLNYRAMDINTTSPLKLFEYMASKRPIVATRVSTLENILQNGVNAVLADPTVKDFVKKLEECIEDKRNSEQIALHARDDVQRYTWQCRAEKILSMMFMEKTL
jgi:glycosyltransferase involved in cell wall biosynthesis